MSRAGNDQHTRIIRGLESAAPTRRRVDQLPPDQQALAISEQLTDDHLSIWPARFDVHDIVALREAGIPPEQAERWPARFDGHDIVALERSTELEPDDPLTPEHAAGYPEHLTGAAIVALYLAAIDADVASLYPSRFSGTDIARLDQHGISGVDAGSFPSWTMAGHIIAAVRRRISAHELAELAGGNWGPPDPDAYTSLELCRDLFGDQLLPISQLNDIRPLQHRGAPPLW